MGNSKLLTQRMSDVKPEPISWLWPNKIPMGKLSLIVGHPGEGKGLLTLDMAARVTTGQPWPGDTESRQPGSVILLTPEDDPADTIRPRLDVAGADAERVHIVQAVSEGEVKATERAFSLSGDIAQLRTLVEELKDCGLIIIDPISAYFGTEMDSHKDTHVRALLMPLVSLAAETGVAIVCVSHMNKAQGPAINRGMGSMGFTGVARIALMLKRHPSDSDLRLLCPIKCNVAKDNVSTAFRVVERNHPTMEIPLPAIEWEEGEFDMTADDLLDLEDLPRSPSKLSVAKEFLLQRLSNGPVSSAELTQEADDRGISERTLTRAKESLKIQPDKESGVVNGGWMCSLPPPDEKVPEPL